LQLTIVDREPDDYAALAPWMATGQLRVRFITDANLALRCARQRGSSLWMINFDLPELGGLDLCQMLSATSSSLVFLVANRYDPDQERAARARHGALYLCKPLQFDWIDQLRGLVAGRSAQPKPCFAARPTRRQPPHHRRTRTAPAPAFRDMSLPVAHLPTCL
jgi:DNA-binding response OmpR family regulator